MSRGHRYNDIVNVYSYELVSQLMHGIALNKRVEQVEYAHATTVAVAHCLDMALGKGKGKILEKWTKEMLDELPQEERKKRVLTDDAKKILAGFPIATIKKAGE